MGALLAIFAVAVLAASGSSKKTTQQTQPVLPPYTPPTPPVDNRPPAPQGDVVVTDWGLFGNLAGVQAILIDLGYNLGSKGADGKWGKKTRAAVHQFQQMAKSLLTMVVRQDGKLDNGTLAALEVALDVSVSGGQWPTPEEWTHGAGLFPEDPPTPEEQADQSMLQNEAFWGDRMAELWAIDSSGLMEADICQFGTQTPAGQSVLPWIDDYTLSSWLTMLAYWSLHVGLAPIEIYDETGAWVETMGDPCQSTTAPLNPSAFMPFSQEWHDATTYRDSWLRINNHVLDAMGQRNITDERI